MKKTIFKILYVSIMTVKEESVFPSEQKLKLVELKFDFRILVRIMKTVM